MTTVYEFELPRGYQDPSGAVHKKGKMRLATAGDELTAARDPRVLNNPSYLTIVLQTNDKLHHMPGFHLILNPCKMSF